jgi:serine/threonine-protein kinase
MTTSMLFGDGESVPVLESRYVTGEVIGSGSVGIVYAARDTLLGIDVAVKVMREEYASSPAIVAQFAHEARVSARMLSPHVVKVLGVAVTSTGTPCIIYERLCGESLAERMDREGTLSLSDTTDIVRQTAMALARVHKLGFVHRDVKPANIFLVAQPDGRTLVKLLDFGIAAETDACGSAKNELIGTPEYIAPEVLFGKQHIDARADLYALGVVAFECLTGRCPFPGATIDDVFLGIARGARVSLSDLRPELDNDEIEEWMGRALHPDAFWRFSSAKDLVEGMVAAVRSSRRPSMPMLRSAA